MKQYGLPLKASEYIKDHFPGSFLSEMSHFTGSNGHVFYTVEIAHDERIYHLKFDDHGLLVSRESEEAFPEEESVNEDENDNL